MSHIERDNACYFIVQLKGCCDTCEHCDYDTYEQNYYCEYHFSGVQMNGTCNNYKEEK